MLFSYFFGPPGVHLILLLVIHRRRTIVGSMRPFLFSAAVVPIAHLAASAQAQSSSSATATSTYLPPPAASGAVASAASASPNPQWSQLLGNSLYFYDVQRAGKLPDNFRVSWRNDSVLNDGKDVGLDLSGGFFDAGNFIKATFPLCWTITQLSWAAMMFGGGYDAANQTSYLDETLRVGLDWLLEASSQQDSLVVLIGNQGVYWGGDQDIPSDRPSYKITRQNPGTDVFGSCASALTSASMLYAGTALPLGPNSNGTAASLRNTTYSRLLLNRGQSLFNLAQTATPQQVYQTAVPQVKWAYPSTDYADELVLSATFLAMATGNKSYSDYAQTTYTASHFPFSNGALNWDQHTPAAPVLLAQASLMDAGLDLNTTKYQSDAEYWLDLVLNGQMSQTFSTSGGLFWFKGDSDSASLNPSLNAASLAVTYHGMASSTQKGQGYLNWALSQQDYALGKNPMNAVYSVGLHPNSAQNPQSALASGGTDAANIDASPPTERWVLYGGLVGGPDKQDNYYDQRSDYEQTEVAIDSNPPLMTLIAYHIQNGDADPFYVSLTQPRVILPYPSSGGGGGLSGGAKAGVAIAVILVIIIIVGLLSWWQRERLRTFWRRKRLGLKT